MSRKHYIAVAEGLRSVHQNILTLKSRGVPVVARLYTFNAAVCVIADVFQSDNARFNRQRFLDAIYK